MGDTQYTFLSFSLFILSVLASCGISHVSSIMFVANYLCYFFVCWEIENVNITLEK